MSISSPRRTPQWPCAVYSQRQTSVSRSSSGKRARSARSACWTIPSAIQAPEPSSSFSSGMPKRITALTPARSSSSHSRTRPVDGQARHRRQRLVAERLGRDEERHHEVVERELGLADEVAQGAGAAQAAEPGCRERAHARRVRDGARCRDSRRRRRRTGASRLRHRLDLDRDRPAARPRLELDPLGEELPDRLARRRGAAARSARRSARRCSCRRAGRRSRAGGGAEARSPSPSARRCGPRSGGSPRKSSTTQITENGCTTSA